MLAVAGLMGAAASTAATAAPATVEVRAVPGARAQVERLLGQGAVRVERRRGDTLQVTLDATRVPALRRRAEVAQVTTAPGAFSDEGPVVSQGIRRTGAAAVQPAADGGAGLTIAILDLGFGANIPTLQAAGELPAAVESQSFDAVSGLAGVNAYGNPTNHGELVAQTVFDYAPKAQYVFVNYRTDQDFLAAVDWLIARRPDIVVHSNSFIEGPFDGTSAPARAVNRAADAGILWFNSAGNYQRRMWSGPWNDTDGNGDHDFAAPDGGVFYRGRGTPITFALTWRSPEGSVTDLDLELQRRSDDGASWQTVVASADRQTAKGAWASERFTGYLSPVDGFFRVRIMRASGPPPAGDMTLVSREIDMALFGGSIESSVPTPGDSTGAVAVGAVDWRGDRLEDYSSIGPTDDGRMKPDLVAPTDTALAGPRGPRLVGGTSNAAPNAAGAAAVLMASLRRAGQPSSAADVRASLAATALDLGTPGPDMSFGAGRVRVDTAPPAVTFRQPSAARPLRGAVPLAAVAADPSGVARLALGIGPRGVARAELKDAIGGRFDTRTLRDGTYPVWVDAADWPGNAGRAERAVVIDNTRPAIVLAGPAPVAATQRKAARKTPKGRLRPMIVRLTVRDAAGGSQAVVVRVDRAIVRRTRIPAGVPRTVNLGRRPVGARVVQVTATDRAGNVRSIRRVVRVR